MFFDQEEKSGTILYIEDNDANRMLVRRVLMAEGYTVIEVPNPLEAIDKLKATMPNLILMDINMPEIDGYTLTAMIREYSEFDHIPIIALTANVMKGDKEKSLEAGCDGYIQKPIDIDTLPVQVDKYMKLKR